jgi:tetratricopeptide (TPR) repeat protein
MGEPTSPMLERLQEFLKANPKDSFVRYGYSMELSKLGRIDEAVASFRQLIQDDPGYVPAYMQAGSVLARAGRKGEAKEVFLQGIAAAARAGESHAHSELQGMLDGLSL